jgi:hypothetical protein
MKIRLEEIQRILDERKARGEVDKDGNSHVSLKELTEMLTKNDSKQKELIMPLKYNQSDIQLCINCLNDLTTKGVENARLIAIIADKLLNPLPEAEEKGKEEPDASHKEE